MRISFISFAILAITVSACDGRDEAEYYKHSVSRVDDSFAHSRADEWEVRKLEPSLDNKQAIGVAYSASDAAHLDSVAHVPVFKNEDDSQYRVSFFIEGRAVTVRADGNCIPTDEKKEFPACAALNQLDWKLFYDHVRAFAKRSDGSLT